MVLVSFFSINGVFAETYNVEVSAKVSSATVVKGDEVSIILNIKSNSSVDMCSFEVSSSSELEYVTMNDLNSWKYDGTVADFLKSYFE